MKSSQNLVHRFGPLLEADATTFRLWAPELGSAHLLIQGREPLEMVRAADGFFELRVTDAGPGTLYMFQAGDLRFPDLASRRQAVDVNGWSVVASPPDGSASAEPLRPWHETVICEVHVGTVTPEGTFTALKDRLEHFRDAGFTCLELMPLNAFPGTRNWGYDGTLLFAPAPCYGTPDDLKALVDRAHQLGLCMIHDVVYNHFGETSNFVERYAPSWFDESIDTPWGAGINFNEPMVRQFYYENAMMWLSDYEFDGLRFDSVHEMKTKSRDRFLGELAEAARAVKPHARLIVENVENSFRWLERDAQNMPMTYWAQWNDDMHHVLDFLVTGDGARTGYDDRQKDAYADLEKALADGFVHDPGEGDQSDGRTRGGPGSRLPPDCFITYVQNHDQIGNRSDGKRLPDRTTPRRLDFAHFLKCLAPQIPLCFMGDEGNMTSSFPFFTDLPEAAAKAKRDDRYKQMHDVFHDDVAPGGLPDPNDPKTFEMAKIAWDEYERLPERRASLERFRALLQWRREKLWPLAATPCIDTKTARQGNCLVVNWVFEAGTLSMALNPTDAPADMACVVRDWPVSTGAFSQQGEVLRLGAWSAVVW